MKSYLLLFPLHIEKSCSSCLSFFVFSIIPVFSALAFLPFHIANLQRLSVASDLRRVSTARGADPAQVAHC